MKDDSLSQSFAVKLSLRGDTVYFCPVSGRVSLRPFAECSQAIAGVVSKYIDPIDALFEQETMELPAVAPLEIVTHDRIFDLLEVFA